MSLRLNSFCFLFALLCCTACHDDGDSAPDTAARARMDTLLHRAAEYAPDALMDSLRSLPAAWADTFCQRRLTNCYTMTDVPCIRETLRQYAQLRPNDAGRAAVSDFYQGILYQWAARYDSAELCYARAAAWFEQARDTTFLTLTLSSRSGNFSVMGQSGRDIQTKYQILTLLQPGTGPFYANRSMLANSLVKNEDYDRALELIPPASLDTFATQRDTIGWAYALVVLGNAHYGKKQYPEARAYLGQALALRRQAHKIPLGMRCESYYLYGRCIGKMGDWQESLDSLRVGEALGDKMPNKQGLTLLYLSLGEALFHLGRMAEAEAYLRKSLDLSMARKQITSGITATELLCRVQKKQGRTDEALALMEQYVTMHDTLFNREKEKIARDAATRYEIREKEQHIAALQIQNRLSTQRNWWIAGSLALLFGGILIRNQILGQRQREKAEHEKTLAEAQSALMAKQLDYQQKELQAQRTRLEDYAQMLIDRNQRLAELSQVLERSTATQSAESSNTPQPLEHELYNQSLLTDADWEKFKQYFSSVYPDFLFGLKKSFPNLSAGELRLVMLAKMGLSTKESASILGISAESVKKARYRLRKKLGLQSNLMDD